MIGGLTRRDFRLTNILLESGASPALQAEITEFLEDLGDQISSPCSPSAHRHIIILFRKWKTLLLHSFGQVFQGELEGLLSTPIVVDEPIVESILARLEPEGNDAPVLQSLASLIDPLDPIQWRETIAVRHGLFERSQFEWYSLVWEAEHDFRRSFLDSALAKSERVVRLACAAPQLDEVEVYLTSWAFHMQGKVSVANGDNRGALKYYISSRRLKGALAGLPTLVHTVTEAKVQTLHARIEGHSPDAERTMRKLLQSLRDPDLLTQNESLVRNLEADLALASVESLLAGGDLKPAKRLVREARRVAESIGDRIGVLRALVLMGFLGWQRVRLRGRINTVVDQLTPQEERHPYVAELVDEARRGRDEFWQVARDIVGRQVGRLPPD